MKEHKLVVQDYMLLLPRPVLKISLAKFEQQSPGQILGPGKKSNPVLF